MTAWPHTHVEMISPGRTLLMKLRGPWILDQSEHHPAPMNMTSRIQIGDFEEFGRGLVIDGTVQLTEAIDPLYTGALVFPAALLADSRKRWLIIGGGDGGCRLARRPCANLELRPKRRGSHQQKGKQGEFR